MNCHTNMHYIFLGGKGFHTQSLDCRIEVVSLNADVQRYHARSFFSAVVSSQGKCARLGEMHHHMIGSRYIQPLLVGTLKLLWNSLRSLLKHDGVAEY